MQPFELRGGGLLLATPTVADVDRITQICQDPEIQRWTSIPVPYERRHAEFFVTGPVPDGWASDRELTWAVRQPEDRHVLGMISLRLAHDVHGEIGFTLAPEARGRGVMSRAVRLVAEYAFAPEGLGLTHLHWWAYVGNWSSRRVAWATGFQLSGLIPGARTQRGHSRDSWVATLAAGDPMRPRTPWLDPAILRGDVLTLRPFQDADVDSMVEACSDPLTQHWLTSLPVPYTRRDAVEFIGNCREDAAGGQAAHWAIALADTVPAVGALSLMGLNRLSGGAEVGYWVHPAVRGRGVAAAAVGLLADHAFASADHGGLGLHRLVVAHAAGNDASRRVIEHTGFRPAGVERAAYRLRTGEWTDLHWYDMLSDDPRPRPQTSRWITP